MHDDDERSREMMYINDDDEKKGDMMCMCMMMMMMQEVGSQKYKQMQLQSTNIHVLRLTIKWTTDKRTEYRQGNKMVNSNKVFENEKKKFLKIW